MTSQAFQKNWASGVVPLFIWCRRVLRPLRDHAGTTRCGAAACLITLGLRPGFAGQAGKRTVECSGAVADCTDDPHPNPHYSREMHSREMRDQG
jgi:hypothetical protein